MERERPGVLRRIRLASLSGCVFAANYDELAVNGR
jgi:hypothetical protein